MKTPTAYGGSVAVPRLPTWLGSQSIINILLEQGVDTVFGYLGAAVLPLFEQIGKVTGQTASINDILPIV